MIITKLSVLGPLKDIHSSFASVVKEIPQKIIATTYHNGREGIIDKGERKELVEIKPTEDGSIKKESFDYLITFGISIEYTDIFDETYTLRMMPDELFEGVEYHGTI